MKRQHFGLVFGDITNDSVPMTHQSSLEL